MNPRSTPGDANGFSLVEVVIAIVVLSVGLISLLSVFLVNVRHSADPLALEQANAVAQAYMEEILLKAFCDPNDFSSDCPAACSAAACGACSGSTVSGGAAENRSSFDDVCDYDGLADSGGALDQTGAAVPGLDAYNVTVSVDDNAVLNGLSGAAGQVLAVTVNVSHD